MDYFALAVAGARHHMQLVQSAIRADAAEMDNAVAVPVGPRACCAEYGRVVICEEASDTWRCGVCAFTWESPCTSRSVGLPVKGEA